MGMFGFDGQARVMKEDTGSVGMKVGMVGLMVEREKVMGKRNEETEYEDEWNEMGGLTGCVRNRGCRVIPNGAGGNGTAEISGERAHSLFWRWQSRTRQNNPTTLWAMKMRQIRFSNYAHAKTEGDAGHDPFSLVVRIASENRE